MGDEADVTMQATSAPPTVALDGLNVKRLLKDPDAIILYALLVAYLFIPEAWRVQAVDRLDDPLAMTLIGLATGGRFLIRATGANAKGNAIAAIGPEVARAETIWAAGEASIDPKRPTGD